MSIDKKLASKLANMIKLDQAVRRRQWQEAEKLNKRFSDKNNPSYKKVIKRLVRELMEVDTRHTNKMKRIIAKHGWPGISLVGKRGTYNAWLLVQHADHDLKFQTECLNLLEKAAVAGEAEKKHHAYLTDRVLVHQNRKQIYGTQFRERPDGTFEPFSIRDKDRLALYRKKVGLEPFTQYVKKMKALNVS